MGKNRDHSKFPNAITVLDNGNVGISQTSPSVKLDINTGALANSGYDGLRIADDASHFWFLVKKDGSGNKRFAIYNGQGATPITLQEGGGNVGIGTTNPNWSYPGLTALQVYNTSLYGYNGYSAIAFNLNFNNNGWKYITNGGGGYLELASGGDLVYYTAASGGIAGNSASTPVERFRIMSTGMFAIGGNASSGFKLAVEDNTAGGSGVNKFINITNQADADLAINITKVGATDKYVQITPSVSGLPIVIGVNNNPVKKPSNPAFSAYYTTGGNVSGASVKLTGYTSTTTNIGNCYNTSNCRFTANVAGMYLFKGQAWLPPGVTLAGLAIRVNGNQRAVHRMSHTGGQSNYSTLTPTLIWYLNIGDYVELYTSVDGGEIHLSTTETYSNFSGVFLG